MIHPEIQKSLQKWLLEQTGDLRLVSDCSLIDYLSNTLYHHYEPTTGQSDFRTRLRDWIFSHPLEQRQQVLLQFVPYLLFFGPAEFAVLRRQALYSITARWLVGNASLDLTLATIDNELKRLLHTTVFVALTKSGRLHDFCKTNGVVQDQYLQADTLYSTGITPQQKLYLKNFSGIVLIEDFIGSGIQSRDIVEYICTTFCNQSILCVPLLCCPEGSRVGEQMEQSLSNLKFRPVLSLSSAACLTPVSVRGEISLANEMRQLVSALPTEVSGYRPGSPYGFADTGALSVLYFNCPDNVLELVHTDAGKVWSPLFPRV